MTQKTLEQRIQAIEDRQEIIDLLCRYAYCIDRREWAGFAALFADEIDANLLRTDGWVRMPSAELVRRVSAVFASYTATQHLSANHHVTIDGDTAVAWSSLNATHYLDDAVGDTFHQQVGYYEYRLERSDRGWRITALQQLVHWQRGNQQIFDRTLGS